MNKYPLLKFLPYSITLDDGVKLLLDVALYIKDAILFVFVDERDITYYEAIGFFVVLESGEPIFFIDKNYTGKLTNLLMNEIYKKVKIIGLPTYKPIMINAPNVDLKEEAK